MLQALRQNYEALETVHPYYLYVRVDNERFRYVNRHSMIADESPTGRKPFSTSCLASMVWMTYKYGDRFVALA